MNEEILKNFLRPIAMIALWIYIALALVFPPFPINILLGVVAPITGTSMLVWHHYKKRPQYELDEKVFPTPERLRQLSEELKAKAEAKRG